MRVYGYIEDLALRGDILSAEIDAAFYREFPETVAGELGWAFAGSFAEAKKKLLAEMYAQSADPEVMALTRKIRARDC